MKPKKAKAPPKKKGNHTCPMCTKSLKPRQKYCGRACQQKAYRERQKSEVTR